jgi:hypothetical protein
MDATGFTVQELHGGQSSVAFSYRVVARRKDVVAPRLAVVPLPTATPLTPRPSAPESGAPQPGAPRAMGPTEVTVPSPPPPLAAPDLQAPLPPASVPGVNARDAVASIG